MPTKNENQNVDIFEIIKSSYRLAVKKALSSCDGKKVVLMDSAIVASLGTFASAELFQKMGVKKIYKLPSDSSSIKKPMLKADEVLLFFARPEPSLASQLADWIALFATSDWKGSVHVFQIGNQSLLFEEIFKRQKGQCPLNIRVLPIDAIPINHHTLSLETPQVYRKFTIEGNYMPHESLARSIRYLEALYGKIPQLISIGNSQQDTFLSILDATKSLEPAKSESQFLGMILIDKCSDYVTPLLMQESYLGLLDECFGLEVGGVIDGTLDYQDINDSKDMFQAIKRAETAKKGKRLVLGNDSGGALSTENSNILAQLADLHLSEVGSKIQDLKKEFPNSEMIQEHYVLLEKLITWLKCREIRILRTLQKNVLQGIFTSNDAELVEELIFKQYTFERVLSLLVLLWIILGPASSNSSKNKISSTLFQNWEQWVLQSYGYEKILKFHELEQLGLWGSFNGSNNMKIVSGPISKDLFRQLEGYTIPRLFGDWIPFSVPLTAFATNVMKTGLDDSAETNNKIRFLEKHSKCSVRFQARCKPSPEASIVLLVFPTGSSYAEQSFLRALNSNATGIRYIILTACILNSKTLVL